MSEQRIQTMLASAGVHCATAFSAGVGWMPIEPRALIKAVPCTVMALAFSRARPGTSSRLNALFKFHTPFSGAGHLDPGSCWGGRLLLGLTARRM